MWRVISASLGLKGHRLGRLLLLAAKWLAIIPARRGAVPALAPFSTSCLIKLQRGFWDMPSQAGRRCWHLALASLLWSLEFNFAQPKTGLKLPARRERTGLGDKRVNERAGPQRIR